MTAYEQQERIWVFRSPRFAQSKIALGICFGANRATLESISAEFPHFSRKRELLNY